MCQGLFFNNVAGLRPATLSKKRIWHKCFPVNFAKFLRTPFSRTPPDDCFCKKIGGSFADKMSLYFELKYRTSFYGI